MATKTSKKKVAALAVPAGADPALDNLKKIDHLVIMMMENRSFDHMLGYLTLDGRTDVDGLDPNMFNMYQPSAGGAAVKVKVKPMTSTGMVGFHDPCHEGQCVDQQMSQGNGGFAQNYHDKYPADNPDIVMRYFRAKDVPVYDFFAKQFAISDRWFSPVPGATWPNRLYAISGVAAGSRDNTMVPLYSNKSFVRQLDKAGVSWKGYGDQTHYTIKLTDSNYRSSPNFEPLSGFHDNYGFIHDALKGQLPSVSFIDPHFFRNDDHPPSDIALGQALVARVYSALAQSPQWNKTLLVVLYDEHGGFFDHVPPGPAVDDSPVKFGRYGIRVPALFIGSHVDSEKCFKTVCDHTSLIKTILLRFCQANGAIPNMGKRVANAAHLGEVLSLNSPRAAPALPPSIVAGLAKSQATAFVASISGQQAAASGGADERQFIAAIKKNAKAMQAAGKSAASKKPKSASK